MTLSFPHSVATFADVLRMSTVRSRLVGDQQISGLAGGRLIVADLAPKYWEFEVGLINMENAQAKRVQALIEALDESINDFYLYDPRSAYPAYDPTGAILAAGTAITVGGEAAFGNVATGVYRAEGSAVPFSLAFSIDSDAGTYWDAAGVLQLAAADVPRIDYGPFPNYVRNPIMTGAIPGTPGTLSNNWFVSVGATALTRQVVAASVADGINYLRLRFFGTAAAAGSIVIGFENGSWAGAVTGQTWTGGLFLRWEDGLLTGLSNYRITMSENTSGGSFVAGATTAVSAPTKASLISQRKTATRVFSGGGTVGAASHSLNIDVANGAVVDVTIDIGFPTLERAASASPYPRVPIGVAAETACSNMLSRSEELNDAVWGKMRATVTQNATIAPDGTMTADKLIESTTAGSSYANQNVTVTAQPYTGSVFLKAAEKTQVRLQIIDSVGVVSGADMNVDLKTGSIISGTGIFLDVGNGWYRVAVTGTPAAGTGSLRILLSGTELDDGTSGAFVWGAMMEPGSVLHDYVKTTSAPVSRAADLVTFKASGINDFVLTLDNGATQGGQNASGNWSPASVNFSRPRIRSWSATRDTQVAAEAVQIAELAVNNKELKLKKLPAGFQIKAGELLAFDFGSPVKRALHRIVTDAVAGGDGVTDLIEVRPHILPGAAVDAVVTLIKPAARCKMLPGSFDPGTARQMMTTGMSFKARQVI